MKTAIKILLTTMAVSFVGIIITVIVMINNDMPLNYNINGINIGIGGISFGSNVSSQLPSDSAQTQIHNINSQNIKTIDIETVSTNVNFIVTEEEPKIEFINNAPAGHKKVEFLFSIIEDNDSLEIDVKKPNGALGFNITYNTQLNIYLPKSSFDSIDVDSVSGNINAKALDSNDISFSSVSGNISFSGSANSIDLESTSGNVEITVESIPNEVDLNSISGNIKMNMKENSGFIIDYSTVSGGVKCSFTPEINYKKGTGRIVYKESSRIFDMKTISGNIKVDKID